MMETELVCESCGSKTTEVENFCPDCGTEDPWVEQPKYDFEDVELPYVFDMNLETRNYELWDAFCHSMWNARLGGDEIANLPDEFPQMKTLFTTVYVGITEDFEIVGPYLMREEAVVEAEEASRN